LPNGIIQMANEITTVVLMEWRPFNILKIIIIFYPYTFLNKFEYIVIDLCASLSVGMI